MPLRLKRRLDLYFGSDPLNTFAGIILHRIGFARRVNVAAWSSASKLTLKRHVFGGPSEDTIGEQIESAVDARPLDQVFSDYDISPILVKIDVEGAEHEILRGMERTIRGRDPMSFLKH